MTSKEKFIEFVEKAFEEIDLEEDYNEIYEYFENFKGKKEKVIITEKGSIILQFMKDNADSYDNKFKASEIGDGIGISGKSVSGSMRKLIAENFVEKVSTNPVCYSITELGKTFNINVE